MASIANAFALLAIMAVSPVFAQVPPPQIDGAIEQFKPGDYLWAPDIAPQGPVMIIVSGRDQRIVVLRNGVEIGSSAIAIDGPVTTTEAFTLNSVDSAGAHWLRLPLPGQAIQSAAEMTPAEHARGHFPEALRRNILGIIEPGTTLLVARDSIKSSGTGTKLTVITADDK